MSRIKIRDLFAQAGRLKAIAQRLDFRWLHIHRTYSQRLATTEKKSSRALKEFNKVLDKLKRAGYSVTEIFSRMKKKRTKK